MGTGIRRGSSSASWWLEVEEMVGCGTKLAGSNTAESLLSL